MHIHSVAASSTANSLAGAALAAETALAKRRAQELRDAGSKLKGASLEAGLQFADQLHTDSQFAAQPQVLTAVGAVTSGNSGSSSSAQTSSESFAQRFTSDVQLQQDSAQVQEVPATPSSAPVSYWA
jgi:hypothetical protein